MKRLLAVVLLLIIAVYAGLGLASLAHAEFLEGVEYVRLEKPVPVETGDKIEVREFFWYGCQHCFALEAHLEKWLMHLPAEATFIRTPGVASPAWAVHARTYFAFEEIGLLARAHRPLFDAIHTKHRKLAEINDIGDFVAEIGGDRTAFMKSAGSFDTQLKVNRATALAKSFGVDMVPILFVDGKYLTNATIAGDYPRALEVVDFLIRKAAAERKASRPVVEQKSIPETK
jgi:thiol:disulfide interchange protein DsbA